MDMVTPMGYTKDMKPTGDQYSEGARMFRLRLAELGMSQGQAAQKLGVLYPGHVNRWLQGLAMPGVKYAVAIEEAFGVPVVAWTQEAE